MPDKDGYPTEEELKKIREWDIVRGDPIQLMNYVRSIWWHARQLWREIKTVDEMDYDISTGGWSGNEDLIGALSDNQIFWTAYWHSSTRGGKYQFIVGAMRDR
jgi:hypothetical protein